MYAQFYGLTGLPFQLTPDSRFFFRSTGHARAISHLIYGLEQQEGFIVVTGEVGAGKTTLVELLWSRLDSASYVMNRIMTTRVSADDLMRLVASGFGVGAAADKAALLRLTEEKLREIRATNRRALLVIDEVQNLSVEGLKELRMLSNLTADARSLLQIILLGQPEFRQTIAKPELNQVRQCVLASYHLGPLTLAETQAYVEHRLAMVGWDGRPAWQAAAFASIHQHTSGIPRRINRLCSRLLLHGALEESDVITAAMVEQTAAELDGDVGEEVAPATPVPAQAASDMASRVEMLQGILKLLGATVS